MSNKKGSINKFHIMENYADIIEIYYGNICMIYF